MEQEESFQSKLNKFIQVCLWMAFILYLMDPGMLGPRPPESPFATYAFMIDPYYRFINWIVTPIYWVIGAMGLYSPYHDTWFPFTSGAEFAAFCQALGFGFIPATIYEGAINWWVPLSSFLYWLFLGPMNFVYDKFRNWAWNIIIEYVFQRKKAREFQQELDKKNKDFMRLNTQYRQLAEEAHSLKDSVLTDELTQVFNKRFFLNRLQQDFDLCRKDRMMFSLIMIDIDYFKRLNDTYGHLAGDDVLKAVAGVIKRFSPDLTYPCRYGGEEFSVIMPKKGPREAMETARLIQENTQMLRFPEIDPKLRVSVSQGICTVDFASHASYVIKHYDDVISYADQELYRSKINGRNRVSTHTAMDVPGQQQTGA